MEKPVLDPKAIKIPVGEDARSHWYYRCIIDAYDHRLHSLYALLVSMRRRTRDDLSPLMDGLFPRFGDACRIRSDGIVTAKWQYRAAQPIIEVNVGTTKEVEGSLRRLADRQKLSDANRKLLFQWFNDWIEKDERATSEI